MSVRLVELARRFVASSVTGIVPTSRSILTNPPLTGGGNLSGDLTLDIAITPTDDGGAVALQAASPGTQQVGSLNVDGVVKAGSGLQGNVTGAVTGDVTGNVTGNLTGDVTGNVTGYARQLKTATGVVNVYASAAPTIGQVLVASDATTASWASVAGTGTVTSVDGVAPIVCTPDPIVGSGTIGIAITAANDGGAVALQSADPGTAQAGTVNINGRSYWVNRMMIAPSGGVGNPDGAALGSFHISRGDGLIMTDVATSGGGVPNTVEMQYSRGTVAAPTVVQATDVLARWRTKGYNNNGSTQKSATEIRHSIFASPGADTELAGQIEALCSSQGAGGLLRRLLVTPYSVETAPLVINGPLSFPITAATLANGQNHNINIGATTTFNAAAVMAIAGPTGVFSLTGLTTPYAGRLVIGFNTTAFQMTLEYLDAGSTAGNQIWTPTGADVNCKCFLMLYDNNVSQWRLLFYV